MSLSVSQQTAVRRLLLAELDPVTVVDELILETLCRLVPGDGIGWCVMDAHGYAVQEITAPRDLHAELAGEPACEDGEPTPGVAHLAALPPDDESVLLHKR